MDGPFPLIPNELSNFKTSQPHWCLSVRTLVELCYRHLTLFPNKAPIAKCPRILDCLRPTLIPPLSRHEHPRWACLAVYSPCPLIHDSDHLDTHADIPPPGISTEQFSYELCCRRITLVRKDAMEWDGGCFGIREWLHDSSLGWAVGGMILLSPWRNMRMSFWLYWLTRVRRR